MQVFQDNLDPISDDDEEEPNPNDNHPNLQSQYIEAPHPTSGSENEAEPTLPESNTQLRVSSRARKLSRAQ